MFKSFKKLIGISTLALVATFGFSHNAMAQKGGDGQLYGEVTWPTTFTLDVGAAANDNWQGNGSFLINGQSYEQSHGLANPEFHIGAEIPVAKNMMISPRIAYNDYSVRWDNASTGSTPLALSYTAIGLDMLFKYSLNNFHLLAGANASTPLNATYASSFKIEDATHSNAVLPGKRDVIASLKGGVGYDIPLNSSSSMWLTPEAMYTYPLTNFSEPGGSSELFITGISGGASLKFAF